MIGIRNICGCVAWSLLRRRRILVTMVMMAVLMMLMVSHQSSKLLVITRDVSEIDKNQMRSSKPFIPSNPSQIVIRKPPNIPREFLIEEEEACFRKGEDVEVVAYVHSTISRVEQRRLTRLTWASSSPINMVVVFVVGQAKNDQEREILQRESELYHDIVQGDYGDHYHLLTYKALSSLYWITKNCAHVPWTLHADDDLLVDTYILQKLIKDFDGSTDRDMLHCRILKAERIQRRGRWKVDRKEYAARRFPPFCQGPLWLVPTKEIPRLLKAATSVNFLWVDDAYITGVLAKHAGMKISPIPKSRFGIGAFSEDHLGEKVVWFHFHGNQTEMWYNILEHHNATEKFGILEPDNVTDEFDILEPDNVTQKS